MWWIHNQETHRKNFKKGEALLLSYPNLRFNPYKLSNQSLFDEVKKENGKLSSEEKNSIKIIYGEEVPYGVHKLFKKKARYVAVFRDPTKRTISLYNFYRTRYEKDQLVGKMHDHYTHQLLINGRVASFE